MEKEDILKDKHRFLKSRLKKYRFVRFKDHYVKSSLLEAVFSRGDRDLTGVLVEAWLRGARFDSWRDLFSFQIWDEAFRARVIYWQRYLRSLDYSEILPWDHIDTGIKKSYLWQELEKAKSEKTTASCFEIPCQACQGCIFESMEKERDEDPIRTVEESFPLFGKETGEVIHYRAFYAKENKARYLSHIDLNNAIQRSFRRAGVPIIHSQGFHPKMNLSYLPALPLGMEGKREVLEFKSGHILPEDEFLSRLNSCLPSGLKFLGLERLTDSKPSLHKDLKTLVYSIDLGNQKVSDVLHGEKRKNVAEDWKNIQKKVEAVLKETESDALQKIYLDRKVKKITLYLSYSSQKSVRPQDIAVNITGLKNPAFIMAREGVLFKSID